MCFSILFLDGIICGNFMVGIIVRNIIDFFKIYFCLLCIVFSVRFEYELFLNILGFIFLDL